MPGSFDSVQDQTTVLSPDPSRGDEVGPEDSAQDMGLADAQSVCIDATTLQANASMKSLVRARQRR